MPAVLVTVTFPAAMPVALAGGAMAFTEVFSAVTVSAPTVPPVTTWVVWPGLVRSHYPLHPRAGHEVEVLGRSRLGPEDFFIVRQPDGTSATFDQQPPDVCFGYRADFSWRDPARSLPSLAISSCQRWARWGYSESSRAQVVHGDRAAAERLRRDQL